MPVRIQPGAINRAKAGLRERSRRTTIRTSTELVNTLSVRTPVDTGLARNSIYASIGVPTAAAVVRGNRSSRQAQAGSAAGRKLASLNRIAQWRHGQGDIHIGSGVNYFEFINTPGFRAKRPPTGFYPLPFVERTVNEVVSRIRNTDDILVEVS